MARIGSEDAGKGLPFMLRVMQELMRPCSVISAPARAIGRKIFRESKERQAKFLHAGVEMAIAAGKIIARKALRGIGHVRTDMGIGRGDEIASAADEPAMRVIWQSADLRSRPEFRA